ncbi:MAG TPA: NYN domain-containing protein [Rhabdochlamydiaceae bacterium]|nr:NYN domain-containing protein [Rhabdochlamydiaceae bacterium]
MEIERIICFVDGFNMYHALKDLRQPHLKWLDLRLLFSRLTKSKSQVITQIYFFSAYPTWKPDSFYRHRLYIKAISAHGVTPVMGQFKNKPKICLNCKTGWISHEEKETDVNIALAMLDLANKDRYDHAFLLTRDSDLTPAVRLVKQNFPNKKVSVFSPYNYKHSSELIQACDGHKTINLEHISTSLFPEEIYDAGGNLVVKRPPEYAPPVSTPQTVAVYDASSNR